jgi:hypothetical protein
MDKHVSTLHEVCWERDKTFIVKMAPNCSLMELTKTNLLNLCDIITILGLPCNLPMLEFVHALMKFAQAIDVFICDYIVVIKYVQNVWIFKHFLLGCKLFKVY